MTREELLIELQDLFTTFFKKSVELREETTANDIEDWDSFTHMSLISDIEEKFNIQFNFGEIMDFQNIGDMLTALHRKL